VLGDSFNKSAITPFFFVHPWRWHGLFDAFAVIARIEDQSK
jgi:hypothetical protein